MVTFILPGYSSTNEEWLKECAMGIKTDGFIRPIFWDHWKDPSEKFNVDEKATLISRHTKGEKINIIAKSIGTLVATIIIDQIPDQINKVIFNGIPLNDISESDKLRFKKTLANLDNQKIICFQNVNDPHASFQEVKAFLPKTIKVISKDRSDHNYPFFSEFKDYLTS